jgi:hypothetical protein
VAESPDRAHIGSMVKSDHIVFKAMRNADDKWDVLAHCPGVPQPQYIGTFVNEDKAGEWIVSSRSAAWARTWGARND